MKKKLLAILSLACSAVMCAVIGFAVLNSDKVEPAHAEGESYTKEIDGVTYTFDADPDAWHATELGDIAELSSYHAAINAGMGYQSANTSFWNTNWRSGEVGMQAANANFVKTTGGIKFSIKSTKAWMQPDSNATSKTQPQVNIYVGSLKVSLVARPGAKDLVIQAVDMGSSAGNLEVATWGMATSGGPTLIKNFFKGKVHDASEQELAVNNDFHNVVISRCATTDGNGYWLKMSFDGKTVIDTFVARPLYTEGDYYDNFGIANHTTGKSINSNFEPKSSYRNPIYIGRSDTKHGVETYTDIADYDTQWSDDYAMGFKPASNTYMAIDQRLKGPSNDSLGLEFRMKHNHTAAEWKAILANTGNTDGKAWYWMSMRVGNSFMFTILNTNTNKLRIQAGYTYAGFKKQQDFVDFMDYDLESEYVWRLTRTATDHANGEANTGSIVRVYIGKIDAETGAIETGWDINPRIEYYDPNVRSNSSISNNSVCVQNVGIGNNATKGAHSMTFSSNKYVGVKTTVNDETMVSKAVRGENYVLPNISNGNLVHVGYSKGASEYSEEDFIPAGGTIEKINEPVTLKALTIELGADKQASMRFRQRKVNGQYLPMEISLKWNITINDANDLAGYFGGIKLGYKLSASNGASVERAIEKVSNGITEPYSCSVLQSNIDAESYAIKFTLQAYVELGGVKYYSDAPDMTKDGVSVNSLADGAVNAFVSEVDDIHCYEIIGANGEVLGYHYLTQEQYDLVVKCCSVNE